MSNGKLILIPVTIGGSIDMSLPAGNHELMDSCHTFIVEEVRTARRFLKSAGYPYPIDDTVFLELNEHTDPRTIGGYLDPLEKGENVGLLSEAGLPCIADPGALVTQMAQRKGIEVIPLVGPSSLMMTLMASGLNGQNFAFAGYLPVDRTKREKAIKMLEARSLKERQTQIFIEAPYRNNQLMQSLVSVCRDETLICVGCDIMLPTQSIRTLTAAQWRKKMPELHKRNTVFAINGQ
ncbi:MAG: SAM-dependent methyltransferase [Bacteroidales bacterium]|nr:SAM-dependent methyltransferase [Bacteroidales bacterium]